MTIDCDNSLSGKEVAYIKFELYMSYNADVKMGY